MLNKQLTGSHSDKFYSTILSSKNLNYVPSLFILIANSKNSTLKQLYGKILPLLKEPEHQFFLFQNFGE